MALCASQCSPNFKHGMTRGLHKCSLEITLTVWLQRSWGTERRSTPPWKCPLLWMRASWFNCHFRRPGPKWCGICSFIICDSISITHVRAQEAFDSWLRLLMASNAPFGDKYIFFAGDFRHVLPVVPNIHSNAIHHIQWRIPTSGEKLPHIYVLYQSMRVAKKEWDFTNFLLAVWNATLPVPSSDLPRGSVVIPS